MAQLVQDYQKQNPSLSSAEVQQAMQIAKQATGMTKSGATGLILGVGVALFGALAAGLLFFRRSGGEIELPTTFPLIAVIGLMVLVLGVVAVVRNQ
jgi:hypothetical protein